MRDRRARRRRRSSRVSFRGCGIEAGHGLDGGAGDVLAEGTEDAVRLPARHADEVDGLVLAGAQAAPTRSGRARGHRRCSRGDRRRARRRCGRRRGQTSASYGTHGSRPTLPAAKGMRIDRHSWGLNCPGHEVEPNMMPYIPNARGSGARRASRRGPRRGTSRPRSPACAPPARGGRRRRGVRDESSAFSVRAARANSGAAAVVGGVADPDHRATSWCGSARSGPATQHLRGLVGRPRAAIAGDEQRGSRLAVVDAHRGARPGHRRAGSGRPRALACRAPGARRPESASPADTVRLDTGRRPPRTPRTATSVNRRRRAR